MKCIALIVQEDKNEGKGGRNSMDEFIKVSMIDLSRNFFSWYFIQENFFKDLLVKRYCGIPKWKKKCNNGILKRIYKKKANGNKDILFEYKEKRRKREISVSYQGMFYIGNSLVGQLDSMKSLESIRDRCNKMLCLSDDFEKLLFDLALIQEYSYAGRIYHPVRKETFGQKNTYIKLLFLFFAQYGYSAKQLMHLMDLMQEFDMSSRLAKEAFSYAVKLSDKEQETAIHILSDKLSEQSQQNIKADVMYLYLLGDYFPEQGAKIEKKIEEIFKLSAEEIAIYKYQIEKEIINE